MAMVSEFIAAINQISNERGIPAEDVFRALENAIAAAYMREYGIEGDVFVEMDRTTGDYQVLAKKTVVEGEPDDATEISIKEAQEISPDLNVGDVVEMELPVEGFGRIAAQVAKQTILQGVREAEKDAIIAEYSDKVGEILTGLMQRMQGGKAVFEIGKALAYMPREEQIANEFYKAGERYKLYLKEIGDQYSGQVLIVSRADPGLLTGLFEMEVPEIRSGVIEIKAVAREAGSRSKVAVASNEEGIDPIGACVGQRGVRIASIMNELGMEKIDIIEWREDLEEFIEKALSPAQVESVELNEDGQTAKVIVPEDQLSLAIGKDGQNVRLAFKLTGIKLDIIGRGEDGKLIIREAEETDETDEIATTDSDMTNDQIVSASDDKQTGLDPKLATKLQKAGVSVDEAKSMTLDDLMALDGIGKVTAQKIVESFK